MAKISVSEAAKRYAVSRPTLQKHLKNGKISGEKVDSKGWQLDTAELARVYEVRGNLSDSLPEELSGFSSGLSESLKAEIERLKAELASTTALAEARAAHIEDLRLMLPAPDSPKPSPDAQEPRKGFWGFFKR